MQKIRAIFYIPRERTERKQEQELSTQIRTDEDRFSQIDLIFNIPRERAESTLNTKLKDFGHRLSQIVTDFSKIKSRRVKQKEQISISRGKDRKENKSKSSAHR
jgi:hypothetical protein